jgi:hypothetical protein
MEESKWISVDERLPEKPGYDWVLVATKMVPEGWYGVPHIAELRSGVWYDNHLEVPFEEELSIKVTHWTPMPPNPTSK